MMPPDMVEFHEYADFFPLMEGEEFEGLVEDIRENGLLEAVVRYEGKILDGRNRFRACLEADVEPRYTEFRGENAIRYVWSKNALRRHLTGSQIAAIALEMEEEIQAIKEAARERMTLGKPLPEGEKGEWAEKLSERVGGRVSGRTIRDVDRVKREAPDLYPEVRSGRLSAEAAVQQVRQRKAQELAKEDIEREDTKKRQEDPREVKNYLEATEAVRKCLSSFYDFAEEAIGVARYGKFSPEAMDFTIRRHESIREAISDVEAIMKDLEEVFNDESPT